MQMREPYVGEGADGARRSAQIDLEECDTLPPGELHDLRLLSAERWQMQAEELEWAATHAAGHQGAERPVDVALDPEPRQGPRIGPTR